LLGRVIDDARFLPGEAAHVFEMAGDPTPGDVRRDSGPTDRRRRQHGSWKKNRHTNKHPMMRKREHGKREVRVTAAPPGSRAST
jgi:hypothetical protein